MTIEAFDYGQIRRHLGSAILGAIESVREAWCAIAEDPSFAVEKATQLRAALDGSACEAWIEDAPAASI